MPHTDPAFSWIAAHAGEMVEDAGHDFTSLLYVGWRKDTNSWWYSRLCRGIWKLKKIGILEIFPKNIEDLKGEIEKGLYDVKYFHGDVRSIEKFVSKGQYDVIFWDHGPEHISFSELRRVSEKLVDHAGRMVLYCCPWGRWNQGPVDGNYDEVHRASIEPEHLRSLGFVVRKFGASGRSKDGELVAYKIKSQMEIDLQEELRKQVDRNKYLEEQQELVNQIKMNVRQEHESLATRISAATDKISTILKERENGRDVKGKSSSRVGRFLRSLLWWKRY